MKIYIVEDEKNAREALMSMIPMLWDAEILGYAENVKDAIAFLDQNTIDLVLMDVQLMGGNAFDILESIEKPPFKIVFISANPNFALDAIKHQPVDFLVKPVHPESLKDVLKQVETEIESEKEYEQALHFYKKNKDKIEDTNETISLRSNNEHFLVSIKDIVRLEAEGSYTKFVLINKNILVSKNLKYHEVRLDNPNFIRVHQSHLVNIRHIGSILQKDQLHLKNGDYVPISKRRRRIIQEIL